MPRTSEAATLSRQVVEMNADAISAAVLRLKPKYPKPPVDDAKPWVWMLTFAQTPQATPLTKFWQLIAQTDLLKSADSTLIVETPNIGQEPIARELRATCLWFRFFFFCSKEEAHVTGALARNKAMFRRLTWLILPRVFEKEAEQCESCIAMLCLHIAIVLVYGSGFVIRSFHHHHVCHQDVCPAMLCLHYAPASYTRSVADHLYMRCDGCDNGHQRLVGGGYNILLPEAQKQVCLFEGYELRKVPADGNCLYHSLLVLANDGRSTSVWTVDYLRELAEQPGTDWATVVQIQKLADQLDLRIHTIPVELTDPGLPLRVNEVDVVGPDTGADIILLWWTREHHGLHFDAVVPCDELEQQNFRQLRATMHGLGIQVKKHFKSLHLRSALRRHHHGPLNVRDYHLPLIMIEDENMDDIPPFVSKPVPCTTLSLVDTPLSDTFGIPVALRYILLEGIQLGGLRRKIDNNELHQLIAPFQEVSTAMLDAIVEFLQLSLELFIFDAFTGELLRQQRHGTLHGYVRLACFEHHGQIKHIDAIRLPESYLLSYTVLITRMKERKVPVPKGTQLYTLRAWELAYHYPLGTPTAAHHPQAIPTLPLKKCKLLHWNAGGIRPKKSFIDDLLLEHCPDLLVISETHLAPRDLISFNRYVIAVRLDRPMGGGGGLIVLVHEHVAFMVESTYNLTGLHAWHRAPAWSW